jgi:hypothetical protein
LLTVVGPVCSYSPLRKIVKSVTCAIAGESLLLRLLRQKCGRSNKQRPFEFDPSGASRSGRFSA